MIAPSHLPGDALRDVGNSNTFFVRVSPAIYTGASRGEFAAFFERLINEFDD